MPLFSSLASIPLSTIAEAVLAFWTAYYLLPATYKRLTGWSIADLRGPESPSFLLGNLGQLMRHAPGLYDLPWQDEFGYAFQVKGPFGERRLWLSDPKALQYILQKSGYRFIKPHEARWQLTTATGNGLNSSEGPDHARQRRVLHPAFGGPETKSLIPFFREAVQEIIGVWKENLAIQKDCSDTIDIPTELGKAVLDALGRAAFEYDFGAIQNKQNDLAESLQSFGPKGFAHASDAKIFSQGVMAHIPMRILTWALDFPTDGLRFLKNHVKLCNSISETLIESKTDAIKSGHAKKDVLSLIVKSNINTEAKYRLKDPEIIPQLATLLVAGHETTTSTLTFLLYNLAAYPDVQTKLRAEVLQARAKSSSELKAGDLDALPYLNAVLKETLRFETLVPHIFRESTRDDIIPLSKPIISRSGKIINEIYVAKGTRIIISDIGYNRMRELWGEDSDQFRPERWLDGTIDTGSVNVGVTSNLMSFGSGHRGCIGWRFAYVEIQTFLFELVTHFEFAHSEKSHKMRRENNLAVRAMIEGEYEKGIQLPLRVSLIDN